MFVYIYKNNRDYEKNRARCRLLKMYATLNHGTKKTVAWTAQAGSSAWVEVAIDIKNALKKMLTSRNVR